MRWKPFATLLVLPACLAVLSCGGGGGEEERTAAAASAPGVSDEVVDARGGGDRGARAPSESGGDGAAAGGHPETPKEVVAAIIRAIQRGDRERAEALHWPDSSRWRDAADFETRAEFVRKIEHHLDSNDMRTRDLDEMTAVDIKAVIDGERHIVTWFVMEIDGTLRAGPGQVMLASDEYPWWE